MIKVKKNVIDDYMCNLPLLLLLFTIIQHFFANLYGKMITNEFLNILAIYINITYIIMILLFIYFAFSKRYTIINMLCIVCIGALLLYLTYRNEDSELLYRTTIFPYFLLTVLCKDIKYSLIIKVIMLSLLIMLAIVFSLSLVGELNFRLIFANIDRIRYGIGFFWHTFTFITCFAIYYYIYLRKYDISYYEIAILLAIAVLSYYLTGTKSCFLYEISVLLFSIFLKKYKDLFKYKKVYTYILLAVVLICTIGVVLVTYFYDENIIWMKFLDNILTGRLNLGNIAINEYKITLFGEYKEFIVSVNYVDSSFLRLLLIYGVLFFLLLEVCLLYFVYLIGKKKDIYLFFIFTIVIIQSTFDTVTLFTMLYNDFLFIWSYKNSNLNC